VTAVAFSPPYRLSRISMRVAPEHGKVRSVAMSTVNLSLPESLYKQVCKLAQEDEISLHQFIATAVAEKVAALMTVEYLRERARRGSLEKFEAVLAKVPDVEPEPHDRL